MKRAVLVVVLAGCSSPYSPINVTELPASASASAAPSASARRPTPAASAAASVDVPAGAR